MEEHANKSTMQAQKAPNESLGWIKVLGLALACVCALTLILRIEYQNESRKIVPDAEQVNGRDSAARDAEYAKIADHLFGPAPAAPMTPEERIEFYERSVLELLN